ncbi:MAG: hypothetical protein AAF212_01585 [Verrucomicrobiota bacterium]
MAGRPHLFLILGTPGSGRRGVLLDILENGQAPGRNNVVLMSRNDTDTSEARAIQASDVCTLIPWSWDEDSGSIQCDALNPGAGSGDDAIFIVAEPLRSPVDQIEALTRFIDEMDFRMARILTVVDCARVSAHQGYEYERWLDACIHFTDCVLLNHRQGVSPRWVQDFQNRYTKQHFPCLFFLVKKGKLDNPALALDPEPRRVSLAFDVVEPEFEFDPEIEEEPDMMGEEDPYFVRLVSGQREKIVPQIAHLFADQED